VGPPEEVLPVEALLGAVDPEEDDDELPEEDALPDEDAPEDDDEPPSDDVSVDVPAVVGVDEAAGSLPVGSAGADGVVAAAFRGPAAAVPERAASSTVVPSGEVAGSLRVRTEPRPEVPAE
jgi:hypothetical protein